MRTLRTKKSPFSAAISCPQAAHYLGAAKTVFTKRDGRVSCGVACMFFAGRKRLKIVGRDAKKLTAAPKIRLRFIIFQDKIFQIVLTVFKFWCKIVMSLIQWQKM